MKERAKLNEKGKKPKKTKVVAIMPCTAKKYECDVEEVNDADAGKDVDLVLTTREMGRLINADRIKTDELEEAPFDDFFGENQVIFQVIQILYLLL